MEHARTKKTAKPYSPEFRERAVRLAVEHRNDYQSEAAALTAIEGKLGCSPDSLRVRMRQVRAGGDQPGQTTAEQAVGRAIEAPLRSNQWCLQWLTLCGVRHRCVCAADRGLARLDFNEDPVRA